MRVIAIANQKGGVGKTTTATALATLLRAKGYNTLLIDADKQGSASDTFRAKIEGEYTLYDVLLEDKRVPISYAIQHTDYGDIVPSDPLLIEADMKFTSDIEGDYRLSDALSTIKEYDFVVIDTNPDINHMLYNALIAADYVIVPTTADRYGLIGLTRLHEIITKIQNRQNKKLQLAGILLVKYNKRTRLSQETKEVLEHQVASMGTIVFQTVIRESVKAREAQASRIPLENYAKKSTTGTDYNDFVDEFLKEINNGEK